MNRREGGNLLPGAWLGQLFPPSLNLCPPTVLEEGPESRSVSLLRGHGRREKYSGTEPRSRPFPACVKKYKIQDVQGLDQTGQGKAPMVGNIQCALVDASLSDPGMIAEQILGNVSVPKVSEARPELHTRLEKSKGSAEGYWGLKVITPLPSPLAKFIPNPQLKS